MIRKDFNFYNALRCLLILAFSLFNFGYHVNAQTDINIASSNAKQLAIIKDRIDYYNRTYPDIYFVHMKGGTDWYSDMVKLLLMLGVDADALDYEHPDQVREMLRNVTLERLKHMLKADVVSSTLFRVGAESTIDRKNVCIITLNPDVFVSTDYQATRYMLDLSESEMKRVHPIRYLDHIHHLEFTMDHEVFHCLDSYLHGGAPLTSQALGGEFNVFRRESIADAYALMMHIRSHDENMHYANNIVHARALWFFSGSPNRCTFATIHEALSFDHDRIRKSADEEIIKLSVSIRDKTVGDYDAYVEHRAAAIRAAREIGKQVNLNSEQEKQLTATPVNKALIEQLINRYEQYYQMLFTDKGIP